MKELDDMGLLVRRSGGFSKPNHLYVKIPSDEIGLPVSYTHLETRLSTKDFYKNAKKSILTNNQFYFDARHVSIHSGTSAVLLGMCNKSYLTNHLFIFRKLVTFLNNGLSGI